MTTPDTITWTRHGDTEVAEWRGMRATFKRIGSHWYYSLDRCVGGALLFLGEGDCVVSETVAKCWAESLMRLHAKRDEQAAELSHLRERVEVLEEIANTVASRKRLVAGVLLQDLDCLYTRLAELDKETDDAEA